jgi:hypothetical protein
MNKKERPHIPNLIQSGTNEIESFQNKTLRPIIKMLHNLLIASFQNYLQKRKIDFSNLSEDQKRQKIESVFSKDINYRNISLGHIIGHFSLEEFEFYSMNSSEMNKRVMKIIQKRIQDSLLELI